MTKKGTRLYSELCAARTTHTLLTDRQLDNRLALQAIRSLIVTLRDELAAFLRALTSRVRSKWYGEIQHWYGETARFELEDLLASPPSAVFNY